MKKKRTRSNFKTINNILLVVLIVEMVFLLGVIVIPNNINGLFTGNPIANTNESGSSAGVAFIALILLVVVIIAVFILRSLKKH